MLLPPDSKINLALSVVEKRPDGYHNLETVFYPVNITDTLDINFNNTKSVNLKLEGYEVTSDAEQNLVVKAYRKIAEYIDDLPGVDISLNKTIPFGAGLGGGSSDAAFTLMMINEMCGSPLSIEKVESIAQSIGADCPFFCRNIPVYAEGTGNIFTPVELSLKGYHMVIVKPDIHVSTKEAFSDIIPAHPSIGVKDIMKMPVDQWRQFLINDFEKSVFNIHPAIREIKDKMYEMGAVYSSMTGSGSSVFALFKDRILLESYFTDCFVWQGECNV